MRMIRLFLAVLFVPAVIDPAGARVREFTGIPKILDGDTVQFGKTRLQLAGIDAPQTDQLCFDKAGARWKCGIAAREHLRAETLDKTWKCVVVRKSRYGRLQARCSADGEDIALQMVKDGWALAASGRRKYRADEAEARDAEAGLWSGAFVAPRDWRRHNGSAKVFGKAKARARSTKPLLSSAFGASPPSPNCAIKGNVNWSGKCIFHKPDGRWYKRIKMETKYGDRWFCTPIEAIASGCRETKR